jgi:hypothetical protein
MRLRTLPMVAILILLVFAVPHPALSQNLISLTGVVVGIEHSQETFLLQEQGLAGQGRHWTVRVTASTEVQLPQGTVARGAQQTLSLLRPGTFVTVRGWMVGSNQLVAGAIGVNSAVAGGQGSRGVSQGFRVAGTIVNLQSRGQGIVQLQAQSTVQGTNLWSVRLYPQTQVTGQIQNRGLTSGQGRGGRSALGLLRVGDFVEVVGRLLGNQQIRADLITVHGQSGFAPGQYPTPVPYPTPYPTPYPNPYPGQPYPGQYPYPGQIVIHSPQQGAEIAAGEFYVTGQTMPGAQVRVEVTAQLAVLQLPVTSGTVMADHNGFFVFAARPPLRVPGTTYTVTVTSTYQGFASPPVSVTVRQM